MWRQQAEQHTKLMRSVQYQDKAEPYLGTAFIRTSLAVDQVESSRVYSYDWTLKTRQIGNLRTTVDVVDRSVELKRAVVFHDDQIEAYMSGTAYTHHNATKKPFYCAVAPDYIQAGLIPQWESGGVEEKCDILVALVLKTTIYGACHYIRLNISRIGAP